MVLLAASTRSKYLIFFLLGGIPSEPEIVMVMYPEGFHSRVVIEVEDTQPAIEQPAGGKNRHGHISRRKEVRFHDRKQIYLGIVRALELCIILIPC